MPTCHAEKKIALVEDEAGGRMASLNGDAHESVYVK